MSIEQKHEKTIKSIDISLRYRNKVMVCHYTDSGGIFPAVILH